MEIEIWLLLPLYFSNEHNIFVQRYDTSNVCSNGIIFRYLPEDDTVFRYLSEDDTVFRYLPEDDTVRYRNVVQKYCVRWKNKVVVKAKFQFSFDKIVATASKKLFY